MILREIGKTILPFTQVFGIYVILFGHISPGGGFAGGTILGASLILSKIIDSEHRFTRRLSFKLLLRTATICIMTYGIVKGYSFITGGSHIDAPHLPKGIAGNILSGGYILPLNIAVGIIVAITIYIFYNLFSEGEF